MFKCLSLVFPIEGGWRGGGVHRGRSCANERWLKTGVRHCFDEVQSDGTLQHGGGVWSVSDNAEANLESLRQLACTRRWFRRHKKKQTHNPRLAVSFSGSDPCAHPRSPELVVGSRWNKAESESSRFSLTRRNEGCWDWFSQNGFGGRFGVNKFWKRIFFLFFFYFRKGYNSNPWQRVNSCRKTPNMNHLG